MKRPETEVSISDGQRHLGRIVPRQGAYDCYDAADLLIREASTLAEARRAIFDADHHHQERKH